MMKSTEPTREENIVDLGTVRRLWNAGVMANHTTPRKIRLSKADF